MKFIYIADSHIGGSDESGYRKQPRYLRYFQELIDSLGKYIKNRGDIDCIIHGGDMIDKTSPAAISMAVNFFDQLPCPTYLALGNHDLTTPDSIALWMQYAPQFFPDGKPDFRLIFSGVQLDCLACNWGEKPAFWNPQEPQQPWLTTKQLTQISTLEENCFTQLIITHSPVYGLPPEQHGGTGILHAPAGNFNETIDKCLNNTALVLGAHTHMNMCLAKNNCHFVTVAAFSETPFEFKLIEVTPQKLSMQTLQLSNQVSFSTEYDTKSAYVQGRQCDRTININ